MDIAFRMRLDRSCGLMTLRPVVRGGASAHFLVLRSVPCLDYPF